MEIFYVHWSSYNKKNSHTIGMIIYDNHWFFKYNENIIEEAIINGFRPFPSMTDLNMIYESPNLFPVFHVRYKASKDDPIVIFMKDNCGDLVTDKILIKHVKEKSWQ